LKKLFVAGAALLIAVFAACGSNPSGNDKIREGSWSGMTADSIPISFSVSGSTMENVTFTVDYHFESKPDTSITWSFDGNICNDNTFEHEDENGSTYYSFSIDMNGTFTPPDHVEGSLVAIGIFDSTSVVESDTLSASWTASPD
jgi:hypothetical protein